MKIAYVTRSHDGPQSLLNGGWSIAKSLEALDLGIEHIMIADSAAFKHREGAFPELIDLFRYPELNRHKWSEYDLVLFGEYGFAPFFKLAGIPAIMLVHSLWTWTDQTAHILKAFLPFVDHAICPTDETYGLFIGSGKKATRLSYPVLTETFTREPGKKLPYVVWVGRDDHQKDMGLLVDIAKLCPSTRFMVFSSHGGAERVAGIPNILLREACPRQECHSAIGAAQTMLSTSRYEVFATSLVEGGLCNCRLIAPDYCWGVAHTFPLGFSNAGTAAVRILQAQSGNSVTQPDANWFWENFAEKSRTVRNRWSSFLTRQTT